MRKALIGGVTLAIAAIAAYLGVSHFIGGMVSTQVALYERRLLEIDGVSITRFAYDKRFFDGELIYDIAWRPSREHPLRAAFDEIAKKEGVQEIRLAGRVPVRHGPWVGKFAAARAEFAATLPDEARRQLPKYPGQTPWLTIDAIVEWPGDVNATFRLVDYDGRIGAPEDPQEPVAAIEGLRGSAWIARDATRATFETALSRLRGGAVPGGAEIRDVKLTGTVDVAPRHRLAGTFDIGAIRFDAKAPETAVVTAGPVRANFDAMREWPYVWSGDFVTSLKGLAVETPIMRAAIAAIDIRSATTRKGDKVDSTTAIGVGPATVAGVDLPALALDASLRDLDGDALNAWTEALDSLVAKPDPSAIQRLTQIGARLVAAGPQFAIDRLSLSVRSPDDLKLTVHARPAAGVALPKDRFAPLLEWLEARMTFTTSLDSIEALVMTAARLEAAFDKTRVFGAAEERAARDRFARTKAVLARSPLVSIQGDALRFEAELARAQFAVGGRRSDLLQAFAAAAQGLDELKGALAAAPSRDIPDVTGAPIALRTITRANLYAGPPQMQFVVAGGGDRMDGRLGPDCEGHIDARHPTLAIDYAAGGDEMFLTATSSRADTVLMVRTPGGAWICNDDGPGRGMDPTVRIAAPASGRYLVWVATVEPSRAEAVVQISPTEPARRR